MPDSTNRREFLTRSAACGAAACLATPTGALLSSLHAADKKPEQKDAAVADPSKIPIVDTHQHLWDLTKFTLPWTKDEKKLAKNFVMSDYLAATKGLNVTKTVYMEVDVEPSQQVQEAEYVIDLCRRNDNPMLAAVISGRPASDEFAAYIGRFKGSPYIKGVRQVLHGESTPVGYCVGKQFVKSVQLLGELGMCFDLCMRSGELLDGDKLAGQCPGTRFVVDHCGNMDVKSTDAKERQVWMDGMKALAQRTNTVCKISGIVASAKEDWKPADLEPIVRFSIETFGPDRVMFAGDWPVCTLRASFAEWVGALKEIVRNMGMPVADLKKLFHDNAVRFYGLKDKKA